MEVIKREFLTRYHQLQDSKNFYWKRKDINIDHLDYSRNNQEVCQLFNGIKCGWYNVCARATYCVQSIIGEYYMNRYGNNSIIVRNLVNHNDRFCEEQIPNVGTDMEIIEECTEVLKVALNPNYITNVGNDDLLRRIRTILFYTECYYHSYLYQTGEDNLVNIFGGAVKFGNLNHNYYAFNLIRENYQNYEQQILDLYNQIRNDQRYVPSWEFEIHLRDGTSIRRTNYGIV